MLFLLLSLALLVRPGLLLLLLLPLISLARLVVPSLLLLALLVASSLRLLACAAKGNMFTKETNSEKDSTLISADNATAPRQQTNTLGTSWEN